jgi:putative membrane protein
MHKIYAALINDHSSFRKMELLMRFPFRLLALSILGIVLALAAFGAHAEQPQDFIQKAEVGNQFEISSSKLALEKSNNDQIKQFAQQMIDDHTQAENQIKGVIAGSGGDLTAPKESMDVKHQKILTRLQNESGDDFDKRYIKAQIKAHNDAVSLFNDYAKTGNNRALRDFAKGTLPTIKEHQKHINQISAAM